MTISGDDVSISLPHSGAHQASAAHGAKQPRRLKMNKRKVAVGTTGLYQRFLPADPFCQAPQIQSQFPEQDDRVPDYAARDLLLPDVAMIHGRMIVSAWEFGLDGVDDEAIRILLQAVEQQLKTLLSVVVARRGAYRLRERRFRYAYGTELPAMHLRNSAFLDARSSDLRSVYGRGGGKNLGFFTVILQQVFCEKFFNLLNDLEFASN